MWISTMEISPRRALLTRFLGQFWRGAYFSSFAPLQVQNLPRPSMPPRSDWVRVRNRLGGISGTDLHFIEGSGDFRVATAALPRHTLIYPGHEVVGEIIEVGEDVQRVRVGDRVALQYGQNCVSQGVQPLCRSCAAGQYNLCQERSFSGPEQIGGGWSEEMLVHESQVFRVPDELSNEQAVLIEPSAIALHAVLRHLPQAGDHVLIIGSGSIGLLTLQMVRALAPQATISVMARYPFQVEQATRLGAEHIIYPGDTYQEVEKDTGARLYSGMMGNTMLLGGYDVIYDTIGARRTLHDALRWTRASGTVIMIGISLHMLRIDLTPIWYQEVNLIGSISHGIEQWPLGSQDHYSTFSIAAELMAQGHIHPEKLITHRFALTDFPEAIMAAAGKGRTRAIKVVFDYDKMPASVVPNVRSSARLRRPIRPRAAAGEPQAAEEPQPPESPIPVEAGAGEQDWSASNISGGATWSQNVKPFPGSSSYEQIESEPVSIFDDYEASRPIYESSQTIPQHLLALNLAAEEPVASIPLSEAAEESPAENEPLPDHEKLPSMDEEQTFSLAEEPVVLPSPALIEPLTIEYERTFAVTEDEPTISRPREPEPILLPRQKEAVPEVIQVDAEAAEAPSLNPPTKSDRSRKRASSRKTSEGVQRDKQSS